MAALQLDPPDTHLDWVLVFAAAERQDAQEQLQPRQVAGGCLWGCPSRVCYPNACDWGCHPADEAGTVLLPCLCATTQQAAKPGALGLVCLRQAPVASKAAGSKAWCERASGGEAGPSAAVRWQAANHARTHLGYQICAK